MLGDASGAEADLQQRVRLLMVWQLMLVMVTESTKRGARHLQRLVALVRHALQDGAESVQNDQTTVLASSHTAHVP